MNVFAYGSNLCAARLWARVPSARFLGRARLDGYRLRFHKRGKDGSGKANALRTGRAGDRVWGAIFQCAEQEKLDLDRVEGLGEGYDEEVVAVEMDDGSRPRVRLYVADVAAIDDALEPFTWYHDYVVAGARERRLPADYIDELRNWAARRDPDRRREANHRL